MTWASRATRRQPFPTVRFSSAPTGTSTASRRTKIRSHLINSLPKSATIQFPHKRRSPREKWSRSGVLDRNFYGNQKVGASQTEQERWIFWPATSLLLG